MNPRGRECVEREMKARFKQILRENASALKSKASLLNVTKMRKEINKTPAAIRARPPVQIARKTLENWCKELRGLGAVESKSVGKERYYYYVDCSNPSYFCEEILKPLLEDLEIDDGKFGFSALAFAEAQGQRGVHFLPSTTALLGAGTRFLTEKKVSGTPSGEKTDLRERLSRAVESELREQFRNVFKTHKGVGCGKQMMEVSDEKLEQMKAELKGTTLVFVYIQDGSRIWTASVPSE